jgi:large subunit GTPase 1
MSSRSKKVKSQMGRALYNSCSTRHEKSTGSRVAKHTSLIEKQEVPASLTILEQTHLEEFVHTTELARAKYAAERPEFLDRAMLIVGDSDRQAVRHRSKYEIQEEASKILRRPEWNASMTALDIKSAEDKAFLDWRRNLAHLEEDEGVVLSPFERNVDFWRQLWRTVERSDLIVQIVDARDPLFFLSTDLFRYVEEVASFQKTKKKCLLLINKADFVSDELRGEWEKYFDMNHDFPVVQFSALRELSSTVETTEDSEERGFLGSNAYGLVDADDLIDLFVNKYNPNPGKPMTVGMVGFPNVGKSSVINALLGSKKVSASSTPGKTKHIQTIILNDDITLCDCPGIVLPSVVASKAHLVVNATMPLDHLRGGLEPAVGLVIERIGFKNLISFYKCQHALLPQFLKLGSDARALLSALAVSKKYFLALNVPDESKAARMVLKDICTGQLVHVMHPPGSDLGADLDLEDSYDLATAEAPTVIISEAEPEGEIEDLEILEDDIAHFLSVRDDSFAQPRKLEDVDLKAPTKRAVRMGTKKEMKIRNKFTSIAAASGSTSGTMMELANRISTLKPGSRGRVNKKLADPYGCHNQVEL